MAPLRNILLAFVAITSVAAAPLRARQLAGTGAAADSILTDTDNGVGYGTEDAEDNVAKTITQVESGKVTKRQADKICNGAGTVSSAAGTSSATKVVVDDCDNLDGQTTSDQATIGAQVGTDIETTAEDVGSAVRKQKRYALVEVSA